MNARILLRSRPSGLFYAGSANWVSRREEAFDFQHPEDATQMSRQQQWKGMELIFSYDDPACDLVVPLADGG
jgi:hypothetical protein